MSRKTEAIFDSIAKLQELRQQLEDFNQTAQSRELEDISYKMNQEVNTLKFWIESLYTYTGKSTSVAKKSSSRENGKKGGRPPKEITEFKKRVQQLEVVIPQLQHDIRFCDDDKQVETMKVQLASYEEELIVAKSKLSEWELKKSL